MVFLQSSMIRKNHILKLSLILYILSHQVLKILIKTWFHLLRNKRSLLMRLQRFKLRMIHMLITTYLIMLCTVHSLIKKLDMLNLLLISLILEIERPSIKRKMWVSSSLSQMRNLIQWQDLIISIESLKDYIEVWYRKHKPLSIQLLYNFHK